MLAALLAGHADPHALADLDKGPLRTTRDQLAHALDGRVKPHHCLVLTELLCQVGSLDETIARFDMQIQEISTPFEPAIGLLDIIPGVARPTSDMIVAEMDTEMSRFPSADHLASRCLPCQSRKRGETHVGQDPRPSLLAHRSSPCGPRRRADQE